MPSRERILVVDDDVGLCGVIVVFPPDTITIGFSPRITPKEQRKEKKR